MIAALAFMAVMGSFLYSANRATDECDPALGLVSVLGIVGFLSWVVAA